MAKKRTHGDSLVAPDDPFQEDAFDTESEAFLRGARSFSPVPGPVSLDGASPRRGKSGPSGRFFSATWSAIKLFVGVALVVGLAASVAWGAHRYALTTTRFAIRKVEVQGADRLTAARAERLAGADMGTNLLRFDPESSCSVCRGCARRACSASFRTPC
jgi:hypothetical protein